MKNVLPVGGASYASSNKAGDGSNNPKSGTRASAVSRPVLMRTGISLKVCVVLMLASSHFAMISAESIFTISSTNYSCSTNLVCNGEAHEYTGFQMGTIAAGRLSLLSETAIFNTSLSHRGVAFYKDSVKFLDLSAQQPASFNTSFTIDMRRGCQNECCKLSGEGMAFVISADSSALGSGGGSLGIFNDNGITQNTAIVVEFDTFQNRLWNDISYNHVSFDISNITWRAAKNASDVNITLYDEYTKYSWVEYSNQTQQLELRISYLPSRPISPLLSYRVNLFDYLDEYMWVGFSSGSGLAYSNYFIGDWKFESWFGSAGPSASDPVPRRDKSKTSNRSMILGTSIAIPAALLACVCVVIPLVVHSGRGVYRHLQLQLGLIEDNDMIQIKGVPEKFTYKELSLATNHFNDGSKLGQGGFGNVYRGVLPSSGVSVAVKKIKSESAQGEKEFMAEVSIITQLRLRNLIQLLGWCKEGARQKYLLVYELMPNGSLDKWLFPRPGPAQEETFSLSWEQRFTIVTGTAAALDYLHQGWKQQVIHRDVKSSNIMLDGEWNAKLGDFGLARLVDHQRAASTTTVAGTYGYIAPEVAASGHFTDKTDVFAFGAVVLEVACGRRASLAYLPSEEVSLVDWVWRSRSEGDLLSTVDKRLQDYDTYWMEVVLTVGLLCSHPNPLARPSMKHVVQVLAGDAPVPSIPIFKPAPFRSEPRSSVSIEDLHDPKPGSPSKSRSRSTSFASTSVSNSA